MNNKLKMFLLWIFTFGIIGNLAHCSAQAADCSKHKVYCHIVKNKPSINKKYAMKLSNVIYKKAKKYNVNPFLFSAIMAQESYYKINAKNCVHGLIPLEGADLEYEIKNCEKQKEITYSSCMARIKYYKELKLCTDFGLTQIHYRTAKRYGFEIDRLTKDIEYAIEAGMVVLVDFKKRYSKKEFYWWTRYNSSTPTKREIYRQLVDRFL